jgi:predicted anti-sigma-YlaC factor YlaD
MTEDRHCQEMLGTLSDYIDGALQAELCAVLERHLEGCENCRVVVNTLRKTIELCRETDEECEPLPDDIRQRLFSTLNLEEYLKKT